MRLGYARVSTQDQDTAVQLTALQAAECDRVFQEKASGGRWERPQLQQLLDQLRPDDVLVVWKLDRLSRSLKDLLLVLEKIDLAGAHFQSLTEAIDTSTSAGRMMMHLVGSFAEFERSLLRERTSAGLEEARKAGRIGGRRPKLTSEQQKEVINLVSSGKKSAADAARLFQVHPATVSRLIARHRAVELDQATKPAPRTKRKTSPAKKLRSRKPARKKISKPAVGTTVLDAIGLARSVTFKDFPGAVSVLCEAKTLPKMERLDWQPISPRQFIAVWEAEELIREFRRTNADADIEQRYMVDDKTIIEWLASYEDERANQRVVLQARDR